MTLFFYYFILFCFDDVTDEIMRVIMNEIILCCDVNILITEEYFLKLNFFPRFKIFFCSFKFMKENFFYVIFT